MHWTDISNESLAVLRRGAVIPAHLLALDAQRRLDRSRQRALTRYYLDAGAGGLAVGVHSTQFAIRQVGLYEPVLELAMQTACGLGYHAGLLSLAAMKGASEDALIEHCQQVSTVMPLIGFYLQPALGGMVLPASFWRRFAAIDDVLVIKMAPFNRYRTLDVIRGVVEAGAEDRVTLYTGNDDHIVLDLVTPFVVQRAGTDVTVRIQGGLLGHWSVWTLRAVELLGRIHAARASDRIDASLLALDSKVTDCNGALFDVAHDFAGCHEVLRRQGLLDGIWCLDPADGLSPGQAAELDRGTRPMPNSMTTPWCGSTWSGGCRADQRAVTGHECPI